MKYSITYLFITVIILCGIHTSLAQYSTLSGAIIDENDIPIEEATIYLAPDDHVTDDLSSPLAYTDNTTTDSKGHYIFENIPPGRYLLIAYSAGKRTLQKKITLTNGNNIQNFQLFMFENKLDEMVIGGETKHTNGITRLQPVEGVTINESKKNEVLVLEEMTVNKATNNSRQVFARVPGLNIWQSDDAGIQTGVGGRGLSPNRNTNFNTRQNGYDIAADALGYPESYYTPPVQALERIEIIRGAASLQYGTQFGGMLNYKFNEGPGDTAFQFNSIQSIGSFGLYNSYNSIGGSTGNMGYYGFYQFKTSDGWRPNSELDQHTAYISFDLDLTPSLTVSPEYTYMYYIARQSGGLTDAQFQRDPAQSFRERNWFRVNWNLFAFDADYTFHSKTRLNTRFFGLYAGRDALGNLQRIDRLDHGGERDLLKDDYLNWGNETRLIHRYTLFGDLSVFLAGSRIYNGFTHRRQGMGPDGKNPEFRYLNPDNLNGTDFNLPSNNRAVFVENIFNINPKFSITPGARFEHINTEAEGYYRNIFRDLAGNILHDERIEENRQRMRSFIFFGAGSSYRYNPQLEIYGNYSQNYRAINFNDIRVNVGNLEVDPDIQDERGFNMDLGFRGQIENLFRYDVTVFHLSYEDRIGTVLRTEPNPRFNNLVDRTFRYRTNIADAAIYGFESFVEVDVMNILGYTGDSKISVFGNLAFINATYTHSDEPGITGNKVELVPPVNYKSGLTFSNSGFKIYYQFTYVQEHYTDATNARRTPTAIEGIIPSYKVMDISAEYKLNRFTLEGGINNFLNEKYFTRRATGYPGPGIIPAKIRNFYLSLGIQM